MGTIHTTNTFLPLLRAGTTKKAITISTGGADPDFNAKTGSAGQVGYMISKAALNMAVAKFAAALKREGFVFLSISPGLVDTATTERQSSQVIFSFVGYLTERNRC